MPESHDRKKYRSNFECDSCSGVEGLQRASEFSRVQSGSEKVNLWNSPPEFCFLSWSLRHRVDVNAEGYRVCLWPMKKPLVDVQGQSNERRRPDERSNLCARGAAIGALTAGQSVADPAGKGPRDVSTGRCLRNLKGTPTSGGRREPEKRTSDVVCSAGAECRRSATSIC